MTLIFFSIWKHQEDHNKRLKRYHLPGRGKVLVIISSVFVGDENINHFNQYKSLSSIRSPIFLSLMIQLIL